MSRKISSLIDAVRLEDAANTIEEGDETLSDADRKLAVETLREKAQTIRSRDGGGYR